MIESAEDERRRKEADAQAKRAMIDGMSRRHSPDALKNWQQAKEDTDRKAREGNLASL